MHSLPPMELAAPCLLPPQVEGALVAHVLVTHDVKLQNSLHDARTQEACNTGACMHTQNYEDQVKLTKNSARYMLATAPKPGTTWTAKGAWASLTTRAPS